jgi:hypothetical protein
MSEDEVLRIYTEGLNSMISIVKDLSEKIDTLSEENKQLHMRVQSLEEQKYADIK